MIFSQNLQFACSPHTQLGPKECMLWVENPIFIVKQFCGILSAGSTV